MNIPDTPLAAPSDIQPTAAYEPLPWLSPEQQMELQAESDQLLDPASHCHQGMGGYEGFVRETTLPYPFSEIFPHASYMPWDMMLMGLIWSLALGFAAGNYACSLVHRLPRGLGILEKKPYCGSCNTMLATKDLFPVVSALLLKHKCRYCGAPIPKSHFYTELLIGLLFCLCFLIWGFSESYYLIALLGSMLVVLASIHVNEGKIDKRVLAAILTTGMLYRVLEDGSIYNFFYGGLYALIIGCVIFYKSIERRGHIFVPPIPALLLTLGGICAGVQGLLVFLPAFAIFGLTFKFYTSKPPITVAFGLAVAVTLLLAPMAFA